MKICSKCGIKKSIREYHRNRNHGDGYRSECKLHRRIPERNRHTEIRTAVVSKMGTKCVSMNCRWLNLDGTLGCKDLRLLHIDHKFGGGGRQRKIMGASNYYRWLLSLSKKELLEKFQLLCVSCNWLKRLEESA